MKYWLLVPFLILAGIFSAESRTQSLNYLLTGSAAPVDPCVTGNVYVKTAGGAGLSVCDGATWVAMSSGTGEGVPVGLMTMILSGACPAGWTEVSALAGKTIVGTVAANGNVGTTGGSDSVTPTVASLSSAAQTFTGSSANTSLVSAGTPAGTDSAPVFTGSPLGTHMHAFGTIAVAAHTVVATKQGTGAGNIVTTATHSVSGSTAAITAGTPSGTVAAPVFTGAPMGTHQHTLTATGTNGASAVTGTLNAVDNRSAFTYAIFCRKD